MSVQLGCLYDDMGFTPCSLMMVGSCPVRLKLIFTPNERALSLGRLYSLIHSGKLELSAGVRIQQGLDEYSMKILNREPQQAPKPDSHYP